MEWMQTRGDLRHWLEINNKTMSLKVKSKPRWFWV